MKFHKADSIAHHWPSLDHCLASLLKRPTSTTHPLLYHPTSLQAKTYLQLQGELSVLPPDL